MALHNPPDHPLQPRPCRVVHESIESDVLRGNRFGDPTRRDTPVILPPSYDDHPERRYPVVYLLAAFSGTGWQLLNRSPVSEALDERLARLYAEDPTTPEALVVLPDCFTILGGSQYVNSPGLGRYEDHVVEEVVPLIDRRFRTLAAPEHRGLCGRSSGGLGAMWLAMNHPETFRAVAVHAGDSYFRVTLIPELLKFCRRVRRYGGPVPLLSQLLSLGKGQRSGDLFDLMTIMANGAAYSPDPEAPLGFSLPIDWETATLDLAVLERWLRYDPVEICGEEPYLSALRTQRLIFLDAGTRDEYHLDLGMRQLKARLLALGLPVIHEEFDDGHMNTPYRYDRSLPLLFRALTA